MKRIAFLTALALSMFAATACKQVVQPLPPNAINSVDATVDATLAAASAAVTQYEADVKSGFVPAPALRSTVQAIRVTLTVAIPLYQQWHTALQSNAAAVEPAPLVTAVNSITSNLAALPGTAK